MTLRELMAPRKLAPVLLPWLLLVGTGLWGIDFGFHWDENLHIIALKNALRSGVPLPEIYPYPSVAFWLTLWAALPEIVGHALSTASTSGSWIDAVEQNAYLIRARTLFLLVSSLTVLHVYLTVLVWRRRVAEALLAACIVGLSWEVAYHVRFLAPDGLALAFGSLSLLGCVLAVEQPERPRWLWLAAVAAGLACGSKWTLGLYIVPVVLAALRDPISAEPLSQQALRILKLGVVFGATCLITTPALWADTSALMVWMAKTSEIYSKGHQGYSVDGGLQHLGMILEYLARVQPSRFDPLSLLLALSLLWGVLCLRKERLQLTAILLSVPVLYLAVLCSYNVMVVRNLIPVAPFMAMLAARGIGDAAERLGRQHADRIVWAAAVVVIAVNGSWLLGAAHSIHSPNPEPVGELMDWVEDRPETRFFLSPKVCPSARALGATLPANASCDADTDADAFAFLASEGHDSSHPDHQPTNRPDLTLAWFGPHEINLDYYSSWANGEHVLVTREDVARAFGFPFEINLRELRERKREERIRRREAADDRSRS